MRRVGGRYEPLRLIGRGGMGEVWLARTLGSSGLGKLVALKVSTHGIGRDGDRSELLRQEAHILASLSHRNLVDVFELGLDEGRVFIAMEYIEGVDLRRVMSHARAAQEPLPPALCGHVIAEILAGLHHAHVARAESGAPLGLVHRDVSPTNCQLSFDGDVKLIDFGIAKITGSAETRTGVLKGKFRYMSPEQARGEPLDARSDLYSSAAVLYEAIAGAPLFPGDEDLRILGSVQRGERVSLDPLPENWRPFFERALAFHRDARFGSATEMREALLQLARNHGGPFEASDLAAYLGPRFRRPALPPPPPESSARSASVAFDETLLSQSSRWGPWLALTLLLLPIILLIAGSAVFWLIWRTMGS